MIPCAQILSEGKLLLALFSFVKANERVSQPQEWTVAQFEEIQLHAMSALCTLGPLMIEDYMTCQGSTRSLLLLEWCVGPGTFNTSVVARTGHIDVIRFLSNVLSVQQCLLYLF